LQNLDSTVEFWTSLNFKEYTLRDPGRIVRAKKKSKRATEEKLAPTTKHWASAKRKGEDTKIHGFSTTRKTHYQQVNSPYWSPQISMITNWKNIKTIHVW